MTEHGYLRALAIATLFASPSACSNGPKPVAPSGSAAYSVIPAAGSGDIGSEYRIGPRDVLSLKVFKEDEFDNERLDVSAEGFITVPLIGQVQASGLTAQELAQVIAARLDSAYLVDPQVNVNVVTAATQRLIVEGEVERAGVFPIRGNSSLLEAIALAGGTSDYAKLDQVLVFRSINGTPAVARFNLADIRAGLAPDPQLMGNDTVIVGYSVAARRFRDIIQVAPAAVGIFVTLLQ